MSSSAQKKHFQTQEKGEAVSFYRRLGRRLWETAWVLSLKISTLSEWNQIFDEKLKPLINLDLRGKTGKVTADIVRKIITSTKEIRDRGKHIRVKSFVRWLREKHQIDLSKKTIIEILIANDLYQPSSRRRRPKFLSESEAEHS